MRMFLLCIQSPGRRQAQELVISTRCVVVWTLDRPSSARNNSCQSVAYKIIAVFDPFSRNSLQYSVHCTPKRQHRQMKCTVRTATRMIRMTCRNNEVSYRLHIDAIRDHYFFKPDSVQDFLNNQAKKGALSNNARAFDWFRSCFRSCAIKSKLLSLLYLTLRSLINRTDELIKW